MNNIEFTPRVTWENIFARWWILLIISILGGLIGWIFHFFQPPIYESTASIAISIQYPERNLSRDELDTATYTAGYVITDSDVMEELKVAAYEQGFSQHDIENLMDNSFIETLDSIWNLIVRDRDPETASKFANLWAETSLKFIQADIVYAINAVQIQSQINAFQQCLIPIMPSTEYLCGNASADEIKLLVQSLTSELLVQQEQSNSLNPYIIVSISQKADIPDNPIVYNSAFLVFSGSLIGLIIGIWLTNLSKSLHA